MKLFRRLYHAAERCICLLILFALWWSSCNDDHQPAGSTKRHIIAGKQAFSTEAFTKSLSASFGPADTGDNRQNKHGLFSIADGMRFVYRSNRCKPLWFTENGTTESAVALVKDLERLRWDGIDPGRYCVKELSAALDHLKSSGDLSEVIGFDTSCTRAYLQASRDLLMGVLSPRTADSLWYHANDSVWTAPGDLSNALAKNSAYTPFSKYRSAIPTYSLLQAEYARYAQLAGDTALKALKNNIAGSRAPERTVLSIIARELPWIQPTPGDTMSAAAQRIRGFQEHYGLAPTGKADSNTLSRLRMMPDTVMRIIAANMERLRWMPQALESQYVVVNIPLMELFYRRDGDNAFHMKVVVGKPSRQTPVLNANMANVVFSPSWGVPLTILKQDVLPGISQHGSRYLAKKGLYAYDRHGRMVSAAAVTAKNYRTYTYKQPPGARNALGEVKFNLPNRWDIYLHDTPHRDDFPKRYRAKSSGCVRVEHPREFAEFILRDIEGRSQFDSCAIDSIIGTRKTRYEQLKSKIPVHIVYLTACEDESSGHIRLLPDIYGRDGKLMAALGKL